MWWNTKLFEHQSFHKENFFYCQGPENIAVMIKQLEFTFSLKRFCFTQNLICEIAQTSILLFSTQIILLSWIWTPKTNSRAVRKKGRTPEAKREPLVSLCKMCKFRSASLSTHTTHVSPCVGFVCKQLTPVCRRKHVGCQLVGQQKRSIRSLFHQSRKKIIMICSITVEQNIRSLFYQSRTRT